MLTLPHSKNFGSSGEQFAGIGGLGVGEELVGGLLLYELALVEDADGVGDGGDDGEVVRDEEVGELVLLLQCFQEVEYLGLD